ncbi:MAG: taurine dioxygenase [Ilumatobacteraceae bacterium]|nr:taurine dioxygenase [Ilumatobacteraceae bacterium]
MSASRDQWTTRALTGTFGAELTGGKIRDDADIGWLAELLAEQGVLVIRDQHLTHAEQSAFARNFGEATPAHPVVPGHPDFPEILELDGARGGRNARWHTDVTFVATPPAASVLVADALPDVGGDTLWADLRSGYDRLSAPLRSFIDGLEAVHRITPLAYWGEPFDTAMSRDDAQQLLEQSLSVPPVIHPVVRVHPVTGRRSLFVNPGFTSHIVGLTRIESDGLLALLYEHSTQPESTVRHRWQPGDVVVWDNRCTMHYATDDYGTTDRRTRRITLRGDVAVGPTGLRSRVVDDALIAIR